MNAESDTEFDAAQAFALLGDETRVAILEALAGHNRDPLSFAELRERTGVEDSGRFNYHLGKLVGRFVEKTDEGYRLTYAGSRVVGAVYEGTYAEGDPVGPIELDADCLSCGVGLTAGYADERVTIDCPACGLLVSDFGFPPGAVAGREPEALPALFLHHLTTLVERQRAGFCSNCSGPVEPMFGTPTEPSADAADGPADDVPVTFECERCQERVQSSLASVLLTDPAVVAFHYNHGIDVRGSLANALEWVGRSAAEQVSESPPRYAVTGTLDDETLRVVVDETLEVLETERHSA